eukprot:3211404-Amphidinium_carterae.1
MSWSPQKATALTKQLYDVFQKTGGKPANWGSRRANKTQGQLHDKSRGGRTRVQTSPMTGTAAPATSTNLATGQSALPPSKSRKKPASSNLEQVLKKQIADAKDEPERKPRNEMRSL